MLLKHHSALTTLPGNTFYEHLLKQATHFSLHTVFTHPYISCTIPCIHEHICTHSRSRTLRHTHTQTYIFIYLYFYYIHLILCIIFTLQNIPQYTTCELTQSSTSHIMVTGKRFVIRRGVQINLWLFPTPLHHSRSNGTDNITQTTDEVVKGESPFNPVTSDIFQSILKL